MEIIIILHRILVKVNKLKQDTIWQKLLDTMSLYFIEQTLNSTYCGSKPVLSTSAFLFYLPLILPCLFFFPMLLHQYLGSK